MKKINLETLVNIITDARLHPEIDCREYYERMLDTPDVKVTKEELYEHARKVTAHLYSEVECVSVYGKNKN